LIDVLEDDDPDRGEAEAHIRRVYLEAYQANIRYFLPHMLRLLYDESGEYYSIVGWKSGGDPGDFFLERYLDEPVEAAVSRQGGEKVSRDSIVEVGNLAEFGPGGARDAIVAMTGFLHGAGYRWVVFTGVTKLSNAFKRLQLDPFQLAVADINRLWPAVRKEWGNYYANNPRVLGGEIENGYRALESNMDNISAHTLDTLEIGKVLGEAWMLKRRSKQQ